MNRRVVLFFALMAVLTIVNFLWPVAPSPLTSSSFGKTGSGHGALYDLLNESDLARGRSFESARRLVDPGTLWWIDPEGTCDGRIARGGEVDILDSEDVVWPVAEWIRAGGVGVVFLQAAEPGGPVLSPQKELVSCDAIAGIPLPERLPLGPPAESSDPADSYAVVQGSLLGAPRKLPGSAPHAFEEALDWAVGARIALPGDAPKPFLLLRSLGEGKLVVVADSGFTHNQALDRLDSAPFAIDLVAAFGKPRFDEREHGFLPETSAFRYIAGSPARSVYVGLAFLGLLYLWRGNALPSRSVQEFDPAAPTLETYVTSMAALYAATRDHSRVLERYRELTASRLKRHLGLPLEVSRRELAERIEVDRRLRSSSAEEAGSGSRLRARLAQLTESRPASRASEVEAAAHELDALVMEVTR
jgi:hypothetical protein